MKPILIVGLLIFAGSTSFAQSCDNCSTPLVALYDCQVLVPRPAEEQKIMEWQTLFWPAVAARSHLRGNDASSHCIAWIDGAMVNARELQAGKLIFKSDYSNLPAAGAQRSADYLISSKVQAQGAGFVFVFLLEAAVSRELVKSIEVPFIGNVESANRAGQDAASQMMPLLETIRIFEKGKRNRDINVAIRNPRTKNTVDYIKVDPEKNLMAAGETIDLHISMVDCDGVPLAHRKIIFRDTTVQLNQYTTPVLLKGTKGGVISPATAITDADGKVTVQFKAGKIAKIAKIYAWYPHHKPSGSADAFQGTAIIQINPPPAKYWILNGEVTSSYSLNSDTSLAYNMGGIMNTTDLSSRIQTQSKGRVIAIITNQAEDPAKTFEFHTDTDNPPHMVVSGGGFTDKFFKRREAINGTLVNADVRSDNVSGMEISKVDIEFAYSRDYKYVGIALNFNAVGNYNGQRYSGKWENYGEAYNNYNIAASAGGDALADKHCQIVKTETGYQMTCTLKIIEQKKGMNGTEYITREETLSATLTPVADQ